MIRLPLKLPAVSLSNPSKGATLLFAILILASVFLISLAIGSSILTQRRLSSAIGDSLIAFYAADSGIENRLFATKSGTPTTGNCADFALSFSNGATCTISSVETSGGVTAIRSIGSFRGVKRGMEVSF
ncbi:hypothetical protein HYW30_01475 [Candidatus Azambacteria bacterium]|nr:hypothetical protein [Candidatus Azambacteria bacterium]